MSAIMVSVCVITYNQVGYVRKTLESIMMQKTTFSFEVLVHDDASTDGTTEIVREFEKKYPDIIKPIYEMENQYSRDPKIWHNFQFPIAAGKYIAFCEGDDYWSDEYKLQKQFEAMECHPECSLCTHKVKTVAATTAWLGGFPPISLEAGVISPEQYIHIELGAGKWMFQTSCYFIRSEYVKEWGKSLPEFVAISKAGDIVLVLYLLTKGSVYYIADEMSHYRLGSVGSIGASISSSEKYRANQIGSYIPVMKKFDEYTNGRFHDDVEAYISRCEFGYYFNMRDYRNACKSKYRRFLNELPLKRRIYAILRAVFSMKK